MLESITSAAIGGLVGGFLFPAWLEFWKYRNRPVLHVRPRFSEEKMFFESGESVFVHAHATVEKGVAARGCTAHVTSIRQIGGPEFSGDSYSLRWSRSKDDAITLHSGITRPISILRFGPKDKDRTQFVTKLLGRDGERPPYDARKLILPDNEYEVDVIVTSENTPPSSTTVRFRLDKHGRPRISQRSIT